MAINDIKSCLIKNISELNCIIENLHEKLLPVLKINQLRTMDSIPENKGIDCSGDSPLTKELEFLNSEVCKFNKDLNKIIDGLDFDRINEKSVSAPLSMPIRYTTHVIDSQSGKLGSAPTTAWRSQ